MSDGTRVGGSSAGAAPSKAAQSLSSSWYLNVSVGFKERPPSRGNVRWEPGGVEPWACQVYIARVVGLFLGTPRGSKGPLAAGMARPLPAAGAGFPLPLPTRRSRLVLFGMKTHLNHQMGCRLVVFRPSTEEKPPNGSENNRDLPRRRKVP
ncbi:hypothetical protein ATOP_16000 [Granulimonas faecalis]|uniref:Uncharacterized protein n=1 Tax=Granulimonas faecalis TaxID=2894155 RepID=A0AAV5B673_9ACTN|nr:hypothetical protein ATOP_16000 [Granulimonas faecalis]